MYFNKLKALGIKQTPPQKKKYFRMLIIAFNL